MYNADAQNCMVQIIIVVRPHVADLLKCFIAETDLLQG